MPAPEDPTSHAGRPTKHPDVDIAALYARLQQEVVRTRGGGEDLAGLRDLAERHWAVSAERPLARRPGLRGATSLPREEAASLCSAGTSSRLCTSSAFNSALLQLVDGLLEREARDSERT
jgi:hypothetical protein